MGASWADELSGESKVTLLPVVGFSVDVDAMGAGESVLSSMVQESGRRQGSLGTYHGYKYDGGMGKMKERKLLAAITHLRLVLLIPVH